MLRRNLILGLDELVKVGQLSQDQRDSIVNNPARFNDLAGRLRSHLHQTGQAHIIGAPDDTRPRHPLIRWILDHPETVIKWVTLILSLIK